MSRIAWERAGVPGTPVRQRKQPVQHTDTQGVSLTLTLFATGTSTEVTFRLRNARTREDGLQRPNTFRIGEDIVVSNRVPDQVLVDRGAVVGR